MKKYIFIAIYLLCCGCNRIEISHYFDPDIKNGMLRVWSAIGYSNMKYGYVYFNGTGEDIPLCDKQAIRNEHENQKIWAQREKIKLIKLLKQYKDCQ